MDQSIERLHCDAVVVGAGVAGLRGAIALGQSGARVVVITKDVPEQSSSGWAKGGIAVALSGEEHDLVLHAEDTLRAGAGLCETDAVQSLVRDGRDEVLQLIDWGARFDREGPRYHLTREAAHSAARILHAGGDATGLEIVRALVSTVKRMPNVQRLPRATAVDILRDGEACAGVRVVDASSRTRDVVAGAVLLATGGMGRCWSLTSNPPEATGDGIALALFAGCAVADMEFVQFHPTALAVPGEPSLLLTEALRGEGGIIVNQAGRRFLSDLDPRGELAPRDVVARGIAREILRQGGAPVLLDVSGLGAERLDRRFPGVLALCREAGIDPLVQPIPVQPAAHYAMGGVITDLSGRTTVPGLAAAGEVAFTGVHGANRLASNSLLEGLVFAAHAGRALLADEHVGRRPRTVEPAGARGASPAQLVEARQIADTQLGILRDGAGLAAAVARLDALHAAFPEADATPLTRDAVEAASVVICLRAVARAALWRRESRGAHYREDYPATDDAHFLAHSIQTLGGAVTQRAVGDI